MRSSEKISSTGIYADEESKYARQHWLNCTNKPKIQDNELIMWSWLLNKTKTTLLVCNIHAVGQRQVKVFYKFKSTCCTQHELVEEICDIDEEEGSQESQEDSQLQRYTSLTFVFSNSSKG